MILSHRPFSLPGFEIQQVPEVEGHLCMTAKATRDGAPGPTCEQASRSVQSGYQRHPHDLPKRGRGVRLCLQVRRFPCPNAAYPRQTFGERLPQALSVSVQRTTRWTALLKTSALAVNAQEASRLLAQLAIPASGDTLFCIVKRTPLPILPPPA